MTRELKSAIQKVSDAANQKQPDGEIQLNDALAVVRLHWTTR